MSELSYAQKRVLVQYIEEALEYDTEALYPTDSVSETVDSWMPVYYSRIREAWVEAGCPDPDETMPDNNDNGQNTIHNLMSLGLWETAYNFAMGSIWSNETGEANTHGEALENLRNNYPEWVAQKTTA